MLIDSGGRSSSPKMSPLQQRFATAAQRRADRKRSSGGSSKSTAERFVNAEQKRKDAKAAKAKRGENIKTPETSSSLQNRFLKSQGGNAKANEESFRSYRNRRIKEHEFKGKYYGPDEFKGDLTKLSKWRAAGSPKDKSKFV